MWYMMDLLCVHIGHNYYTSTWFSLFNFTCSYALYSFYPYILRAHHKLQTESSTPMNEDNWPLVTDEPIYLFIYLELEGWQQANAKAQKTVDHLASFPTSGDEISQPGIKPPTSSLKCGYLSTITGASWKITNYSRAGIWRIYLKLIKKDQKMSTCNWLDVETHEHRLCPRHLWRAQFF
jgi:hypothetical protein